MKPETRRPVVSGAVGNGQRVESIDCLARWSREGEVEPRTGSSRFGKPREHELVLAVFDAVADKVATGTHPSIPEGLEGGGIEPRRLLEIGDWQRDVVEHGVRRAFHVGPAVNQRGTPTDTPRPERRPRTGPATIARWYRCAMAAPTRRASNPVSVVLPMPGNPDRM